MQALRYAALGLCVLALQLAAPALVLEAAGNKPLYGSASRASAVFPTVAASDFNLSEFASKTLHCVQGLGRRVHELYAGASHHIAMLHDNARALQDAAPDWASVAQSLEARWTARGGLEAFVGFMKQGPAPRAADHMEIQRLAREASERHGLEPALVLAVCKAESAFDSLAVSRAGAQGVMQLMPATARSLGVTNSFDPHQNIDGGTRYLKSLMQRYRNNTTLALAAYNAGPTKVRRYGGVPPYKETRKYVKRVLKYYKQYKAQTAA